MLLGCIGTVMFVSCIEKLMVVCRKGKPIVVRRMGNAVVVADASGSDEDVSRRFLRNNTRPASFSCEV
jgi:hypothetical protein